MQQDRPTSPAYEADSWVVELRTRMLDEGHDRQQVDQVIATALARFQSARVRSFIPLLVERAVQRAFRDD
jgi:hypothetical protein